jgi:hypothetical protein
MDKRRADLTCRYGISRLRPCERCRRIASVGPGRPGEGTSRKELFKSQPDNRESAAGTVVVVWT